MFIFNIIYFIFKYKLNKSFFFYEFRFILILIIKNVNNNLVNYSSEYPLVNNFDLYMTNGFTIAMLKCS